MTSGLAGVKNFEENPLKFFWCLSKASSEELGFYLKF